MKNLYLARGTTIRKITVTRETVANVWYDDRGDEVRLFRKHVRLYPSFIEAQVDSIRLMTANADNLRQQYLKACDRVVILQQLKETET